jgi:hypothetical protein
MGQLGRAGRVLVLLGCVVLWLVVALYSVSIESWMIISAAFHRTVTFPLSTSTTRPLELELGTVAHRALYLAAGLTLLGYLFRFVAWRASRSAPSPPPQAKTPPLD